jgi:hypothetical protein
VAGEYVAGLGRRVLGRGRPARHADALVVYWNVKRGDMECDGSERAVDLDSLVDVGKIKHFE